MKKWLLLTIALIFIVTGCNQQQDNQQAQQKKQENKENNGQQAQGQQRQGQNNKNQPGKDAGQQKAQNKQRARTPDLAGGKEKEVRRPHPLTLADLRNKYPSTFILSGPSNKRQVALTFDDGPDLEYTPQILDVLKNNNVKATFFVVGNRAEAHPEIVRRMIAEGHEVANHSYNHANLPKMEAADFRRQLEQTDRILEPLIGYSPKLFRPPYGAIDEQQVLWLAKSNPSLPQSNCTLRYT